MQESVCSRLLNMEEIHHPHRELFGLRVLVAQEVGEGACEEEGRDGDEATTFLEVRPDEQLLEKHLNVGARTAEPLHDAAQSPVRGAVRVDCIDERGIVKMLDVLVDERVDERRAPE